MKTSIFPLCLAVAFPAFLWAQPTINTNEFYHIGDVVQMRNCDASALSAGPSGPGVTWDFSALSPLSSFSTTTVAHDTSTVFLTCNLMLTLPNGNIEYMQENSTDSYIYGIQDAGTGNITNYSNLDFSKRPFTYNSTYTDTYRVNITVPLTHGTGLITVTGDAYGTIKLPSGTFNNVLRVRKYQTEVDTATGVNFTSTVSYLWFDDTHTAPLFQMDSVSGLVSSYNDAMYLPLTTGINTPETAKNTFNASLNNSALTVGGDFTVGTTYGVILYNLAGSVVFKGEFMPSGNFVHLEMGRSLSPGMYIANIAQKNNAGLGQIIKVVQY